jgi:hypothetical protein
MEQNLFSDEIWHRNSLVSNFPGFRTLIGRQVLCHFLGHSGLSGALAYYSPKENIFVVGTVNQVAHPDISFKTMIKLTQIIMKK